MIVKCHTCGQDVPWVEHFVLESTTYCYECWRQAMLHLKDTSVWYGVV